MVTDLVNFGIKEITKLLNSIHDAGEIPTDLKSQCTLQYPQKVERDQLRTISLMRHFTKVMLRVLMNRMGNIILPEISNLDLLQIKAPEMPSFPWGSPWKGRGIEVQKDLCFLDYSTAFDKVRNSDLFEILLGHNCDGKYLRVIRYLYWEQEATKRIDNDCSVYKPICRGVRQGCMFFFNIYSEMNSRNRKHHEGVRVGVNNINNLRHAYDTVLIANSGVKLQNILTLIAIESEIRLQLNATKTECMVISKQSDIPVCNIFAKGKE